MTNIQVIQHLIGDSVEVSESRLQVACQLLGLDPSGTYKGNDQKLKCAVYKVAMSEIMRSKGVKRESEGGYSKEYIDGVAPELLLLATDSGCNELMALVTGQPLITDISNLW